MRFEAAENELKDVVSYLQLHIKQIPIITFSGEVGSGKTTLIKALGKAMGIEEHISSPTFGLVHSYDSPNGEVFHSDWYRINSVEELFEAGIDEGLDHGIWFIEWPEMGSDLLSNRSYVEVKINGVESRRRYDISMFN